MRIASQQSADLTNQKNITPQKIASEATATNVKPETAAKETIVEPKSIQITDTDKENVKEKLTAAVETMNEVLETTNKASKFVLHEGLNKYFVRLVDSKTEEVIKEIPPQKLLDAFYEMQKMAGMIVDEKI